MEKPSNYQMAQKLQNDWRNDPLKYSELWFRSRLWTKQQEVMLAVRDYPRVAVRSGNTVGKSRIAAEIILWFLMSHYPAKVVVTAPTWHQIENILWKEIAHLYHKSTQPIGGNLLKTSLSFNDDHFAISISTDEVNRFQGCHSPNLLVVIDEALGVEPMIWEAIEGLHPSRILAIGNPLVGEGNFFNCFSNALWHKIRISCQECVDWQKEHGVIPGLVTQQWINERKEEWGYDSPLFQARGEGEFPEEGTEMLISRKWVDKARELDIQEDEDALGIVANDVASKHGQSENVIGYRLGNTLVELDIYHQIPTPMTLQKLKHKYEMKRANSLVIDSDGLGEGLGDMMMSLYHIMVLEFHGGYGSKAMDSMKFHNMRTQFYWVLAKKLQKGMISLKYLPKHIFEKLKSQLCSIKVKKPDALGRFQIETKEDMMARGLTSPDLSDTLMMSEFAYFMGKVGDLQPASWR